MATPTVTSRPHFTENEITSAFITGGGLALIILAFGLAAMRGDSNDGLKLMILVGILFMVGGTIYWLITMRPWEKFDDLTTPYYTGHTDHAHDAAHDDHAAHDEHDADVHEAIATMQAGQDAGHDIVTHGEPYHAEQHTTLADVVAPEIKHDHTELPPPPVIADPISAFPEAAAADDIVRIQGIGPKIAAALHAAGIKTFADMASRSAADVEKIVRDAGVRMVGHAETWIEDAKAAAAGDTSRLRG